MIALDIINGAMKIVGNLGVGETLETSVANEALGTLNDLLETLSLQGVIWNKLNETYPTVISQSNYTIGTSQNFNTTKPIRINDAFVTYQGVDYPLMALTQEEYDAIQLKTQTAPFPTRYLFVNNAGSSGNIIVWPVPSSVCTLNFSFDAVYTSLTSTSTTISWPIGYARMIRYLLAIELAAEYGKDLPPIVYKNATEAKAAVMRTNKMTPTLQYDSTLVGTPRYNFITGAF